MSYIQLAVAYGLAMLILVCAVLLLAEKAWEYDETEAGPDSPVDDFSLDMPDYGYWLLNYDKWIKLIQKAISDTRSELISQRSKSAPVLNAVERFCKECQRIYPQLRKMTPLFLAVTIAGWAILAAAGFMALLLRLSYARVTNLEPLESVFPVNITADSRNAVLILTAVCVMWLAVCLLVRSGSQLNDKRIRAYQQWVWRQDVRIPLLEDRLEWLEIELTSMKRNQDEAIALHRSKLGSSL